MPMWFIQLGFSCKEHGGQGAQGGTPAGSAVVCSTMAQLGLGLQAEGTAWSCIRGGSAWGIRKRFCPRGWWAQDRLPRAVVMALS